MWTLPCCQLHVFMSAITGQNGSPDSETTISNFHPGKLQGGAVSTDLMEVLGVLLLNSAHLVCQQHPPAIPGQRDNFGGSCSSSLSRNLHFAHADSTIKITWSKTRDMERGTAEGRQLQKRPQSADRPSKMTFLKPDSSNVIIPTNYFHDLI